MIRMSKQTRAAYQAATKHVPTCDKCGHNHATADCGKYGQDAQGKPVLEWSVRRGKWYAVLLHYGNVATRIENGTHEEEITRAFQAGLAHGREAMRRSLINKVVNVMEHLHVD
jgi:hypothetical protein